MASSSLDLNLLEEALPFFLAFWRSPFDLAGAGAGRLKVVVSIISV